MKELRADIQALRGWAVALVVLDHVRLGPFAQGYLGVDIFFVISGFLITGIITRGLSDGSFSFAQFYFRRAKRLLPAAYVTILLTTIGAYWFLTSLEMNDLTAQVLGALTWTTNFVLLWQTDYFAGAADMKPLLHMWSLAVEEQFYLVMPLLLFLTPARLWKGMLVAVCVLSFCLCLYMAQQNQSAAFYMLPSRGWELALGGIGALIADRGRVARVLFWPAIAALVVVPIIGTGYPHPGVDAAIVCVATLIVILARNELFGRAAAAIGFTKLGDISYSLYLVHWPVIAFVNNAYVGEVQPVAYGLAELVISLVLAVALYTLVENPVHRSKRVYLSTRYVSAALAGTFVLGAVQFGVSEAGSADFAFLRRPNVGLDETCDGRMPFTSPACQRGEHPKVMVWGDSFAMAIASGIAEQSPDGIIQATLSGCGPLLGLAIDRPKIKAPEAWAARCIEFGEKVVERARTDSNIKTVVLSSPFRGFEAGIPVWVKEAGKLVKRTSSTEMAAKALRSSILALQQAGKKVVVVGPPPLLGKTDISACVERIMLGKVRFGNTNCAIDRATADEANKWPLTLLKMADEIKNASIVNLHNVLCDAQNCRTHLGNKPVYRDHSHLSYDGASWVAAQPAFHPNLFK